MSQLNLAVTPLIHLKIHFRCIGKKRECWRRLVRRTETSSFDSWPVHEGFVVDKVALGHVARPVLLFSLVSVRRFMLYNISN
jgi:hypothetical protein